ncbi:methyltransferase domain-containing protein [Paraburkholderia lycopersici]|uniref:methyltransferase domain-containing protein n=1 Tax=Paraburkholderia lycopersici TaxID=416944 RepID=UPI001160FC6C|nr:class I SAM-dependent methyltransferase [Paraburkholderia lycopersici]
MPRTPSRAATATDTGEAKPYQNMRGQLRAGVQVVSAPQLFPTPAPLAACMIGMAGIMPGHALLEPSAGTGRILEALDAACPVASLSVTAVELNHALAATLAARFPQARTICRDFLECGEELGTFDRILMNPPFVQTQDIDHIRHALKFLKPGGQLVAICANGPRQAEQLRTHAEESGGIWEPLPAGASANPAQTCMPCC